MCHEMLWSQSVAVDFLCLVAFGVVNLGNFLVAVKVFQHFDVLHESYCFLWSLSQRVKTLTIRFPLLAIWHSREKDVNNFILPQWLDIVSNWVGIWGSLPHSYMGSRWSKFLHSCPEASLQHIMSQIMFDALQDLVGQQPSNRLVESVSHNDHECSNVVHLQAVMFIL